MKKLWKSFKTQIKNSIFKSHFHFVRFGGLLIIPLIYGFTYIFAFFDPFTKANQLPVALVTQKQGQKIDYFGKAMGEELAKENKIEIGEMKLTVKAKHIYADISDSDKIESVVDKKLQKYNVSIIVPALDNQIEKLITSFVANKPADKLFAIEEFIKKLSSDDGLIKVVNNYKKNYVIAFGTSLGSGMSGTNQLVARVIKGVFNNKEYQEHLKDSTALDQSQLSGLVKTLNDTADKIGASNFKLLRTESQVPHSKNKYGFGLAPFFISVAMWVGTMSLTFAINRKIHDKDMTVFTRYFSKLLLLMIGTTIQATILMTALYFVGFNKLGIGHWFTLYGIAIYSGLIFSTIIQAIRYSITSRNIGIFIVIALLILQMCSAGGLFPIDTQGALYRGLNKIVPMARSVNAIREGAIATRWGLLFGHLGLMLIYPLIFIPLGLRGNLVLTKRYYKFHNLEMPRRLKEGKND